MVLLLPDVDYRRREEALAARLHAAASLPAAERSPEAAAFVEAAALLQQARRLLPGCDLPADAAAATAATALGPSRCVLAYTSPLG